MCYTEFNRLRRNPRGRKQTQQQLHRIKQQAAISRESAAILLIIILVVAGQKLVASQPASFTATGGKTESGSSRAGINDKSEFRFCSQDLLIQADTDRNGYIDKDNSEMYLLIDELVPSKCKRGNHDSAVVSVAGVSEDIVTCVCLQFGFATYSRDPYCCNQSSVKLAIPDGTYYPEPTYSNKICQMIKKAILMECSIVSSERQPVGQAAAIEEGIIELNGTNTTVTDKEITAKPTTTMTYIPSTEDPSATDPPTSDSSITDPSTSDSSITNPSTTDPSTSHPATTHPSTIDISATISSTSALTANNTEVTPILTTKGLSPGQYAVLMGITILSSALSIAGSTMIIVMARRKMRLLYHRLVSMLSIADLIFSLCTIMQPTLVPEESGFAMAIGTQTSCTTIAFLFQWAAILSPLYNCILSVYFPLVIQTSWESKDLLWKFEIPAHIVGFIVPLILPIMALITESFTLSSTVHICTFGAYPKGCLTDPEIECERGEFSIYLTLANFFTILIICTIGIIATILVFCPLRGQLLRSTRYNFRPNSRRSSGLEFMMSHGLKRDTEKRLDVKTKAYLAQVRKQALMYSLIFFNNAFWPMGTVILFFVTEGTLAVRSGEPKFYTFMILSHFLYPFAGAMNIMVYIRPKCFEWRKAFPDYSLIQILKNIILDKNLEDHIRLAKRQKAQDEHENKDNQNQFHDDHRDDDHHVDNQNLSSGEPISQTISVASSRKSASSIKNCDVDW